MRPDPACDAVTAALVAGEAPDAAHVAACAACRARAALVVAVEGHRGVPEVGASAPSVASLRAAVRVRAARRVALIGGVAALAAAALLAVRGGPSAPGPDVDLLGALDDADAAVAPAELPGEDLLALVDPYAADPDPLLDALLGEGSL